MDYGAKVGMAGAPMPGGMGSPMAGGNIGTAPPARDTLVARLSETAEILAIAEKAAAIIAGHIGFPNEPTEKTPPTQPGVMGLAMDLRSRALRLRDCLALIGDTIS